MSADAQSVASSGFGGRANTPGPRRLYLGAAAVAAIIAAVLVIVAVNSSGTTSSRSIVNAAVMHRPLTKVYGHVPSYIKIPEPVTPPTPTASAAHPDLTQQAGYAVKTTLAHGTTDLFMAGPLLPRDLANNVSTHKTSLFSSVPGQFEVIFSATHGTVPLSAGQFTLITYRGVVIHPKVTLKDGGPLPATVPDGTTLRLKMVAKVPEGDGLIRWAPNLRKVLVGTFWTTEFD